MSKKLSSGLIFLLLLMALITFVCICTIVYSLGLVTEQQVRDHWDISDTLSTMVIVFLSWLLCARGKM